MSNELEGHNSRADAPVTYSLADLEIAANNGNEDAKGILRLVAQAVREARIDEVGRIQKALEGRWDKSKPIRRDQLRRHLVYRLSVLREKSK